MISITRCSRKIRIPVAPSLKREDFGPEDLFQLLPGMRHEDRTCLRETDHEGPCLAAIDQTGSYVWYPGWP